MSPNEQIPLYCQKVTEQIRWKRVRHTVALELEQHLYDQQETYLAQGYSETEATELAIRQMGDIQEVGQALDKTHRPQTPWFPLILTLLLLALGLALQFMLSADTTQFFTYAAAGVVFLAAYFMDISWLGRHAGKLYLGVFVLSILALFCADHVMGVAVLSLPPFKMMLSNFCIILPVVYGLFIYRMQGRGMDGILLCGLAYLPFAALLWLIPTVTGVLLYTITALILLCTAIRQGVFHVPRWKGLALVLVPTAICCTIVLSSFLRSGNGRLSIFLDPWQDASGAGYLYCILREVVAGSALWGQGAGNLSVVPNLNTDLTLLYGIHHFGLGAFLLLMLVIVGLFLYCASCGMKQQSTLGKLIVLSVSTSFLLQALSYGCFNLGYGFFAPVSFPFLSYGGTALLLNAMLMGWMLSVLRTGFWLRDPVHSKLFSRI